MTITTCLLLLCIGLAIGMISGMVGIGGGVLIIPVLMLAFGFSQVRANGTSLAMLLPPIGIFAVLAYWKAGHVDFRFAGLLAAGFAVGAYLGAQLVNTGRIHPTALRIIFAMLLIYCAGRLLFRPGGRARAAVETLALMAIFALGYLLMRLLGKKPKRTPTKWGMVYRQRQREPYEYDYEI